jgi:hypothetical protein
MTFLEAFNQLKTTRTLTTSLIAPLGVSMDQFLRLSSMNRHKQDEAIKRLIAVLEKKATKIK